MRDCLSALSLRLRQRKKLCLFWQRRAGIRSLVGAAAPRECRYATIIGNPLRKSTSFLSQTAAISFIDALSCVHPSGVAKNPSIFFSGGRTAGRHDGGGRLGGATGADGWEARRGRAVKRRRGGVGSSGDGARGATGRRQRGGTRGTLGCGRSRGQHLKGAASACSFDESQGDAPPEGGGLRFGTVMQGKRARVAKNGGFIRRAARFSVCAIRVPLFIR